MLQPQQILEIGLTAKDETITYREMGETYGITRERIRQILVKHFPYVIKQRKDSKFQLCPVCETPKKTVNKRGRYYSCFECHQKRVERNKNRWAREHDKCIDCGTTKIKHHHSGRCKICSSRHRYYTDPRRREYAKEYSKKWAKNNPDKIKVIQDKAVRKYHEKLKADPIRYAKYLQKQRDRHHKNMQDPEYRKNRRAYYKKLWRKNHPKKLKWKIL